MSTELRDLIVGRVSPLIPTLRTVMSQAVTVAEHAVTDTAEIEAKYRSTRVHVARTKALSLLTARDDLGAWAVDENQAKRTALRLYSDDVVLRLLHSPSVVPTPGKNRARRAWYTNTPLIGNQQLFATPERFLLIWAADFAAGTVAMKVVHPTNAWEFGEKARIDLSIPLDDDEEFTSASFDTRDEEEDLDMPTRTEAAEEEEERDASA